LKFDSYLWIPSKAGYLRRDGKPKVDCILCSIRDHDDRVRSLEVWRGEATIAVLNLYPYNPGHLMVFPQRHVLELSELEADEVAQLVGSINLAVKVLKDAYSPHGFNIGFNIGQSSGASIPHLHAHVVPRYDSELGFVDIIGGAKVLIEDPSSYQERVTEAFRRAKGDGE
jgi:ATP adenylyltransferase